VKDAHSWDEVKGVLQDALERPPEERAAWLEKRCHEDRALLAEVESLLTAHERAGSFGERPALELLNNMRLQSGDRLSVYEISALVGAGGMGEVYKARDSRLDRTVAIKVLPSHLAANADRYQRFEREARVIAGLDHPHIGALYDIGNEDGLPFLVMQYLEGETLADRIAKGPLRLDDVLRYAAEIAEALDHAHRRGVIHRDLKPGNVFLTKSGAKLIDFGLATGRAITARPAATDPSTIAAAPGGFTEEGVIVGTLHYMAPEQLEGGEVDARTDLFAFGIVVYEMVTGGRPFDGGSRAAVMASILETEPPALSRRQPRAPPALDRLVTTCLAKDPDQRWQSAADVARELRWMAEADVPEMTVAGATPTWSHWRVALATGVALLLGVLIGGPLWVGARGKPTVPPLPVTRSIISLSDGTYGDTGLALSPDGTRLAYAAARGNSSQLYVHALDKIDAEPIAGTEGAQTVFFSPDGRWLGFSSGSH
jgi:serine/threonine-protein kinase